MVVIWCALCVSNQVERGICFMATDDSWKTQHFRQSVVAKIDEAIQVSGMPTTKNSMEMENHVFQKAKTKVCLKLSRMLRMYFVLYSCIVYVCIGLLCIPVGFTRRFFFMRNVPKPLTKIPHRSFPGHVRPHK
ncbi:hypothetical protein DBV15_10343 [Temnothorax longispinosus]|uniref:Mediator of RNA polymerase II transcription subunit 15 n=1 Tax=Temnothorax longispinosus TaxID=300112 RepID=A0A4S2KFD6_9HYME|nr:hypothetical protein DBV15_10343 [Temnothorax longispinosus]